MNLKERWLKIGKVIRPILDFIKVKLLSPLNTYGTLLVALCTLVLAIMTYSHIDEAKKMREETKRLADISVEQFKIKSYPTFMFVVKGPSIDSNRIIDSVETHNRGTITAFNVTFLIVHVNEKDKGELKFFGLADHIYMDEVKRSSLDFKTKILPGTLYKIESRRPLTAKYSIENLKYLLLFVRFKVPYDNKFRYEECAYIKKVEKPKSDSTSYLWQRLNDEDTKKCISEYLRDIERTKTPEFKKVKTFLADYHIE